MNSLRLLLISTLLYTLSLAQPQSAPFSNCQSGYQQSPDERRINISNVYTQLDKSAISTEHIAVGQNILRTILIGDLNDPLTATNSSTDRLATLLVHSRALSFELYDQPLSLCDHVLGANSSSNEPACPAPEGRIAIGVATPLTDPAKFNNHPYALTTLVNTLRLLDASDPATELACVDVPFTPYYPDGWFYELIFWIPISIAIAFFVVQSIARISTAYRKAKSTKFVRTWAGRQRLETSVIGGISGQMFSTTPGLLRFVSPSVGNIILHTQWCAVLGMIAVNWPSFAYPFFNQFVWSSLLFNVSLTTSDHVDPLATEELSIPSPFDTLLFENSTSPLYLNRDAPNNLLDNGDVSHAAGLDSLAQVIGLKKDDLFGCSVALALAIAAVLIVVSLLLWTIDSMGMLLWKRHANKGREDRSLVNRLSMTNTASDVSVLGNGNFNRHKSEQDLTLPQTNDSSTFKRFQTKYSNNNNNARSGFRRAIWEMRLGGASGGFHWKLLQGNLLRLLLLFHFPVIILSVYQLSLNNDGATKVSLAFAALALVFLGLAFPIYVLIRVSRTPTLKLYDATRTILALGPLYSVFRPGSHLFWAFFFTQNLIEGIVIGAAQASGTAQSVIILVVEAAGLLMMTVWSPWGYGAQMGLLTFLNSVARVITSALLIVLCPAVNINYVAAGWVTYVIFVIQGLVFATALVIILTKILEGLLRLFAGLPFTEDAPTHQSGLMGAISSIGKKKKNIMDRGAANSAVSNTTSTQAMLDRHSELDTPQKPYAKKGTPSDYSLSFNTAPSHMRETDDDYIMSAWRPTTAFEDSNSSDETHGNYLQRAIDSDSEDSHHRVDDEEALHGDSPDNRTSTPLVPPNLPNSSFITSNDTLHSSQNNEIHSVHSNDTIDTSKRVRTRSFSAVVEVFGEQPKNYQPAEYKNVDENDHHSEVVEGIGEAK
ncbi:hypothetical protein E3Q01_01475 [Wallemia mellicola]|uniref:TRP C-terminal domain-containing protein n=1 Tax=Wallemia mellicola TaxID=1708541 RepID=A0A4T0TPV8_9BASI|nr:hypothetical protein E3Q01_01475 [Wallemia mellicola]